MSFGVFKDGTLKIFSKSKSVRFNLQNFFLSYNLIAKAVNVMEQWHENFFPAETKEQPTALTLREWANEERLTILIQCSQLDTRITKKLKAYRQQRVGKNNSRVEYCYSEYAYNESGRLYARCDVVNL